MTIGPSHFPSKLPIDVTDLCPWRQPQANHAHAQSQGPPESAWEESETKGSHEIPTGKCLMFFLLWLIIKLPIIVPHDTCSDTCPCHHSLILEGIGNFIVWNVTLIGHFKSWVRNTCEMWHDNFHITSWAQCHSWHGLLSWNYLLLCASHLSQLKEIKLKIDLQETHWPKFKRTIQTWIQVWTRQFLGNLQKLNNMQRFQCIALGARPTGRYAARWYATARCKGVLLAKRTKALQTRRLAVKNNGDRCTLTMQTRVPFYLVLTSWLNYAERTYMKDGHGRTCQ